jgi:adenosylcobyric acid synthase
MGFAEAAECPVVLAGDIDRGGVIAQLVGTSAILPPCDRARIRGFLVNKFRGDPSLFEAGMQEIAHRTDWPSLGLIPWFPGANRLPAEDILDIKGAEGGAIKIAVPVFARISNFDDLDPLKLEEDVEVALVHRGEALPGDADLVILGGSKSTTGDLAYFRQQGWDVDLKAHIRRGGMVLGLCGGYQMLGKSISDPEGIEGPAGTVQGLCHLDVDTVMQPRKHLHLISGTDLASGTPLRGYEIHIGETVGADCETLWLLTEGSASNASGRGGQVLGCYLHGLFESDDFRSAFLARFRDRSSGVNYRETVDRTLDDLAQHLRDHMDTDRLLELAK